MITGGLLAFSTLIYFLSTSYQRICNDLAPKRYIFFNNTIDDVSLWGGKTLISAIINDRTGLEVNFRLTSLLT